MAHLSIVVDLWIDGLTHHRPDANALNSPGSPSLGAQKKITTDGFEKGLREDGNKKHWVDEHGIL